MALRLPRGRPARPGHRRAGLLAADARATRRFFQRAISTTRITSVEVVTDHGRLKARLEPIRGLKQDRSARIVIAGHAFIQNVQRGCHELAVEEPASRRVAVAFDELALAL